MEYGNALHSHKPVPTNSNKDIDTVLIHLNQDAKLRLEEVTSLIVTSEAFDEFPQFLVMKAIKLPSDKRQVLIDIVSSKDLDHLT